MTSLSLGFHEVPTDALTPPAPPPRPKQERCADGSCVTPTHLNALLNSAAHARHAHQIHAQLVIRGLASLPFLLNNLIYLYAKCGLSHGATLLFSTAPLRNIVTWTSLITHFSRSRLPFRALALFSQMRAAGLLPNHFTLSAVLPACADTGALAHGQQVHSLVHKCGFHHDVFVNSALVDMYAKCGAIDAAGRMFDQMPQRNLVSWNALIVGLSQNGFSDQAAWTFRDLVALGSVTPDQVSVSSVLSACASSGNVSFGRQVHALAIRLGLTCLLYVINSLADMYGKCGCFENAMKLFSNAVHKDVVTWNVMVTGWVQWDCFEEACKCFWAMRKECISPDEASFLAVLHASACLAALDQGTLIHDLIIKAGFADHPSIGSSLITMYSKCGTLDDAGQVFIEMVDPNMVAWTSMIAACQQHGCGNRAIELFEDMLAAGITPDYITFVCVLAACSHNGLVDEGFRYLLSMSQVHGMQPGSEHYACIVDLLGRAGRLDEAKLFIETIPVEPDASVWGALLGACRTFGNLEMGREIAQKLFTMEPENSGNYVLLCNLYTQHGRLEEAKEVRRLMGLHGVRKETGCSWIDVKRMTYVFTVHDKSHSRTTEIYDMLGNIKELVKKKGYVAETRFAVNDVGEYKEENLWYHSERLALAFGLISLPQGTPILIKKNLRTCGDCHSVLKLVSEIFQREIVVRDINRYHRFMNGICSCKDYW